MPSGGARARSGPPPVEGSGRSDRHGRVFRVLTGEARRGKQPPKFPFPNCTLREAQVWKQVWKFPQAEVWAEQNWFIPLVAHYVRISVVCESAEAKAADRAAMLRLADQVGLTPAGLAQNLWKIEQPGHEEPPARKANKKSSRDRMGLKVVVGGGD